MSGICCAEVRVASVAAQTARLRSCGRFMVVLLAEGAASYNVNGTSIEPRGGVRSWPLPSGRPSGMIVSGFPRSNRDRPTDETPAHGTSGKNFTALQVAV